VTSDFQSDIDAVTRIDAVQTILDVVCRTTGMGFAAVARVTEDRWIACQVLDNIAFGLAAGGELKVETTLCHEIRQHRKPVVIGNVADNPTYASHHTPRLYGLQSYISMPIVLPDGRFFGTLCAIDPRPAQVETPEIVGMFKLFAELIAFHLDAQAKLESSEARLISERESSELREQFIAVLGHDLRNPLASIDSGARLLLKTPLDERATQIVGLMQSTVKRMSGLIDNVLDFARGRLGGGLPLLLENGAPLEPLLTQVVEELRSAWPHRSIEIDMRVHAPVRVDAPRLSQLVSNLLGNALTHGDESAPIALRAHMGEDMLEISVSNRGVPIPPEAMAQLFQPFYRGQVRDSAQGLGLGLYIASEIARAHEGSIVAISDETETRFTFRMPLNPPRD